ncbi:MAG: B12-binding domain-containing radical SAM protein [Cyclobacteriaceae bacterium]
MNKVLLFNPFAAKNGYRIPNSILQVAASINGKYDFVFVDGNLEKDPWTKIKGHLDTGQFRFFGCTVMPGPQLRQAIPYSKKIREEYPDIVNIWGGYFASNQYKTSINSGFVDFIIDGQGDYAFPQLLDRIIQNENNFDQINNLIYKKGDEIIKTRKEFIGDQNGLPKLPYDKLNKCYPIRRYLKKTFLGKRTAAYHASFGCPFTCSFCAVVPIYNARWKSKSAQNIFKDIKYLIEEHGADAVEFHDNNFFVNEKMVVEFSRLIKEYNIKWWGEGRIDTLTKYSDESLKAMRDAGCKMIFFGAESSSDEVLSKMDKGGTQTAQQIKDFAARMQKFSIIPEYSFVLGMPLENEQEVNNQIDQDITFIKEIKRINPDTEIIIYLYSPVPTEGSELYETVKKAGFSFPEKLEDWLSPEWENFDLRRNPLTPWLKPYMVDKIQGFEAVLNAHYPTASDYKLTTFQKKLMKKISAWRYHANIYKWPYELKALQKFWLRYRRPEIEGFTMEESHV